MPKVLYAIVLKPKTGSLNAIKRDFTYECEMEHSGANYQLKLPHATLMKAIARLPLSIRKRAESGAVFILFIKHTQKNMEILEFKEYTRSNVDTMEYKSI
jgi:hypothetical protein